jgi:4a-hydroxytetrahydrobiopterin dehydratase
MPALSAAQTAPLLSTVPSWQLENGELVRIFKFGDFRDSMSFVNQLAELAEKAGHHPDIDIRYSKVRLCLVTHDVGGLTHKDFDLAAKIDKLV